MVMVDHPDISPDDARAHSGEYRDLSDGHVALEKQLDPFLVPDVMTDSL